MKKEPAGLRRWRLAHKRNKTRSRSARVGGFTKRITHHKKSMTLSLGIIGGLAPGLSYVYSVRGQGIQGMAAGVSAIYTGFDPQSGTWNHNSMRYGLMPLAIGVGIHKVASALGFNRAIADAGVPWIRI